SAEPEGPGLKSTAAAKRKFPPKPSSTSNSLRISSSGRLEAGPPVRVSNAEPWRRRPSFLGFCEKCGGVIQIYARILGDYPFSLYFDTICSRCLRDRFTATERYRRDATCGKRPNN